MLTIPHVHDLFAAEPGIVVPPPCELKEGQPDHHTTHLGRLKCCAHQILACTDGIVHADIILISYKVLLLDEKHPTSYLFIVQNIQFSMLVTRLMPCMHYLMHEQFHVANQYHK